MGNIAINIKQLGKMYRIGGSQQVYGTGAFRTFRDEITRGVLAPFRRARDLLRGEAYAASGLQQQLWALKDVSFEVNHGDVVGIIGRNGAGKSTLLKILSRITEPTTGYADVYGRVGALLEVGTGFHPELTGRENVYLNGAILGMSRQEISRKFDDIIDFAGVAKFIDTPVKHYSTGMGLRLGFSVAAHMQPEILVVDEVLAVGDAEFQKKCLGKMSEVASEGRTVLFVSHSMSSITQLCTRCILLAQGAVEAQGHPKEIVPLYLAASSANNFSSIQKQIEQLKPSSLFQLDDIRVYQEKNVDNTLFTHKPVMVDLTCTVKQKRSNIRIGFDLHAADGVLLFRSYHDDMDAQEYEPQRYTMRCIIPANLLMPGQYTLSPFVYFLNESPIPYTHNDVWVQFGLAHSEGVDARYINALPRPGYLLPDFSWYII